MRVSRLVSAPNWRYAIGEVALIVIGVTIALAATSWYQARQERHDEILVLQQLHRTLSEDLQEIEQTWEFTRNREQNLTALVAHLESDLPYTPELGVKFQALLGWRIVSIKTAPFEALKVQSYKGISNPVLREKLVSFYEDRFATLEHNLNLDRDFAIEKVQPYFFRNFTMRVATWNDVDGGNQDWVPIDYDKIKAEPYIANLCRFRADLLRRFALPQYAVAAELVHEILEEIEKELADAS